MILAMHEAVDVHTSHRGKLLSVEVLSWTDAEGRYIVWSYTQLRLDLFFEDLARFGLYRLTPQSRADFSRVLARVRRQGIG